MGNQIIKQPDGLYAVFSSIVDDFVIINATPQFIVEEWTAQYREQLEQKVNGIIACLGKGEKPYNVFTMTFEDAVGKIKSAHGENAESLKILGSN